LFSQAAASCGLAVLAGFPMQRIRRRSKRGTARGDRSETGTGKGKGTGTFNSMEPVE